MDTISGRVPTPVGYARLPLPDDSFGRWLRDLPLKPGRPVVRLFNGQAKGNQGAHAAVVDIDVGDFLSGSKTHRCDRPLTNLPVGAIATPLSGPGAADQKYIRI